MPRPECHLPITSPTHCIFQISKVQTFSSSITTIAAVPVRRDRDNDDAESCAPLADDLFRPPSRFGGYTQGDATYLSLVRFYSNPPNIPALRALLGRMHSDSRPFHERYFPPIIRAFGRAGLPLEALRLFDEMSHSFCCTPSVFSLNSALSSLISSPNTSLAYTFFRRALCRYPSISPNLLSFNLILKALCAGSSSSFPLALELFRSMPLRGVQPDAYTYSTLIAALARANLLDDAFALLDEMQLEGIAPHSVTFNPLLHTIILSGDLRRATNLTRYMLLKGCPPTQATYNTLIHGLCLQGRPEEAFTLINRMVLREGLVPNEVTYGALINGLVKLGRVLDACQVFNLMRVRGVSANEFLYSTLINGLFLCGDLKEAMRMWSMMLSEGVKPNEVLYSVLIDGLSRHGRVGEAEDMVIKMSIEGYTPNVHTYSTLMWGHFRAGNSQQAFAIWTKMVHHGCEPNVVSYNILIHGLCDVGNVREGMTVWKNMITQGYLPDTMSYTTMIRGLFMASRVEGGLRLFYDMIANGEPDAMAYNTLFDGLIKADRLIQAIDLLGLMMEKGCDPDEVTCNIFLKGLEWDVKKGRELMEGIVVRMVNRKRVAGAAIIILVMGKKCLAPRAAIWEKAVMAVCNTKKAKLQIGKFWEENKEMWM